MAHILSSDDSAARVQIRTYDEVDEEAVAWLNRLALDYNVSPAQIEDVRKRDPRLAPELAWYAVEDGEPLSQVGLVLCPVRTVEGLETVGVPMMVCTHPAASGRGFAKALLHHVHDWLRRQDIRLSILTTRRTRVAYPMYRSVGYEDLVRMRVASGRPRPLPRGQGRVRIAKPGDSARFQEAFEVRTKGATGFVIRPANALEIRKAWGDILAKEMLALLSGNRVVGYAWARRTPPVHIRELVTLVADPVTWAAKLAQGRDLTVFMSPRESTAVYAEAGLRVTTGWSVMMASDLSGTMTPAEVRALLGVDAGRFEALPLDLY